MASGATVSLQKKTKSRNHFIQIFFVFCNIIRIQDSIATEHINPVETWYYRIEVRKTSVSNMK